MTAKAPAHRDAATQLERFKALAKEVGADKTEAPFDAAVRKVAAAPPSERKPLKKRPKPKG